MVEESSPLLPPAEESIEAETDTALEPEPESGEPTPESTSDPGFVCNCEERMRSACTGLPFYGTHQNGRYCVLHYPSKKKSTDFKAALDTKLNNKDFDFRGVWFPEQVDFGDFEFTAAADFGSATFSAYADFIAARFTAAANFEATTFCAGADFNFATFSAISSFREATFGADADFSFATFTTFNTFANFAEAIFSGDADFLATKFSSNVDFGAAVFNAAATFDHATLSSCAYFVDVKFHDEVSFSGIKAFGNQSSLHFDSARIYKPDRVYFHTVTLRPHWFVNSDPSQFIFIDVTWEWEGGGIESEIESLTKNRVSSPHSLLAITCHQLADNAEANNRYEEASRFRYWAMDLARRIKWNGLFGRTDWLHMLYWAVSGYGERILRALGVLAAVWFAFVLFYTQVGFEQKPPKTSNEGASSVRAAAMTIEDRIGRPLEFPRALTYSLAVMSLQKPEPKPLTGTAQTFVLLETILGPVQAALLALAIRRKFMR